MRAADCCRIRKFGTILFNCRDSGPDCALLVGRLIVHRVETGVAIRLKLAANLIQLPSSWPRLRAPWPLAPARAAW
jgi:hypothetical protein